MDARPFGFVAVNKDRSKSKERRKKGSSASSAAAASSSPAVVRDDDVHLRGLKRTFIRKAAASCSFNDRRGQRRLPIHRELPTPPPSFERPHDEPAGSPGGDPAFHSKEVDVDQMLAELDVKTLTGSPQKPSKAAKPEELKSKRNVANASKFSTMSTRPLTTAALRRGEIMRKDSDSCYNTTDSAIMDEPLRTSTPVRPNRMKSELSDHLADTSSVGDSGLGNSSAGRRTQSMELLSEDVTSNCSRSTGHMAGSRVKGRSRTPIRREKSEEIVLNKRKGQPKPPFVVPKRPLSSPSKDVYLSSSSLGYGLEVGTSSRRRYYSGCAVHSRTTSESGQRAPVSEAGSTPYGRPLFGQLKKSSSIPVQLTVTNQTSHHLPKSLRPDCCPAYTVSNSSRSRPGSTQTRHDPNCEVLMELRRKNWNSNTTLMSGRSTPTLTARRPVKSSGSIERNPQEEHKSSTLPRDSKRLIPNSKSLSNDLSKMALTNSASNLPSVAYSSQQNLSTSAGQRPRTPSAPRRRFLKKAQQQKTLSASMEIWEIQKELKRGEMVQGMLQLGPSKTCTFGSGRDAEPRICAPVSLGPTSGQMDWRSM